jgi:hypothetical protein
MTKIEFALPGALCGTGTLVPLKYKALPLSAGLTFEFKSYQKNP